MTKAFRLEYVHFKNSKEFERQFYNFSLKENIHSKAAYTTVVIGPNGTGKSRLLKAVVDILNDLYNKKHEDSNFKYRPIHQGGYEISYYMGLDRYKVNYDTYEYELSINDDPISIDKLEMPDSCIAAAYTLHEKFVMNNDYPGRINRYSDKYNSNFYNYLGIKSQNNYAFSSANINKALDLITEAISNEGFNKDIQKVFKFLNFNAAITITYDIRKHHSLFSESQTVETLKNITSKTKFSSGFSYSAIRNIDNIEDESVLTKIALAINSISNVYNKDRRFAIDIGFEKSYDNSEIEDIYKHIAILRRYNLISYDKIFIYKHDRNDLFGKQLELKSLSSGEIHILTSLLSLASVVKDNSLILIDEPELSLHPNWQIRYMDLINKLFKTSRGCHFIIATHSHFIASDMLPESSAILSLIIDKHGKFKAEILPSAYGWSAESILYNVFGVSTTRNYYFEMDLNKMLKLISEKSKDKEKINKYVQRLDRFRMPDHDPLFLLIKEAKAYMESI